MYDIETIRENAKNEGLLIKEIFGLSDEEANKIVNEFADKLDGFSTAGLTQPGVSLWLLEEYLNIKEITPKQLLAFNFFFDTLGKESNLKVK